MTRFFGILLQEKKPIYQALTEIPGVNQKTSLRVCKELGFFPRTPWYKVSDKQRFLIYGWFKKNILPYNVLGTDLRRLKKANRDQLMSLGSFRGIRLRQGLPVRGQKTRNNARTSRKKLLLELSSSMGLFYLTHFLYNKPIVISYGLENTFICIKSKG